MEDYLGLLDIYMFEDLVNVKFVVVCMVKKEGWVIFNVEDEYCVLIVCEFDCNVVFFLFDFEYLVICEYCVQGGVVVVLYDGNLVIYKG